MTLMGSAIERATKHELFHSTPMNCDPFVSELMEDGKASY